MKNIKTILAFAVAVLCAGCNHDAKTPEQPMLREKQLLFVYVDHETGCQYISNHVTSGITPRMNAQGKQICSKAQVTEHEEPRS